jgi:hypothetical protein
MRAGEAIVSPSARDERALVDRAVRDLASDRAVVDVAALAGAQPDPSALVAALREHVGEGAVVACVGVLERLAEFGTVVEALVSLASERAATVVLAVPNHAFAIDDHASAWGEGAVDELRRLLPADHVLFHEVALRGAALVPEGEDARLTASVDIDPRTTAPVAFVLVFGPRMEGLSPQMHATAADVRAEREHDRGLRAELEVLRAVVSSASAQPALQPPNGAGPAETSE